MGIQEVIFQNYFSENKNKSKIYCKFGDSLSTKAIHLFIF